MDSFALIIFGITSNLAQKYSIQALYDMEEKKLIPDGMVIIGNARRILSEKEFKDYIYESLHKENIHHKHPIKKAVVEKLCKRMFYVDGYLDDPNFYSKLKDFLWELSKKGFHCENRIFYLATYPDLYHHIFEGLKKTGLSNQERGWVRIMVEKPIGNSLDSAKKINLLLEEYFTDRQIYRLDHYLGKETLQNILTFRFGNGIFEPLINKDYVDHIQITASEDFGIGKRGGYYDSVGALKDVGQNHLLQMLAFATMDAPTQFSNSAVTKERIKILKNLIPDPKNLVLGQYEGYKNEENVSPNSNIDTYFAFKTEIRNARFKGVPIYVRGGKKLAQTATEVSIVFKSPINRLFKHLEGGSEPNVLIYRIQPNEGIVLKILTKKPGPKIDLEPSYMQYCYPIDPQSHYFPDPYEKLIFDVIKGDQTFFNDREEIEAQWEFIDPLSQAKNTLHIYKPGSWGPRQADTLINQDNRAWLIPSTEFCAIPFPTRT